MEKALNYFFHEHPLFLGRQHDWESSDCKVSGKVVSNLELAYACEQHQCYNSSGSVGVILHKRCGELPRILSDPSHPHPLNLLNYYWQNVGDCDICKVNIDSRIAYRCHSCDFDIHVDCTNSGLSEERVELQHPSHVHPFTLMRKQAFQFMCDGCGTDQDVDMAYVCNTCEYWVHATCASLPSLLSQDRHQHHHQLSLAFCFPKKHCRYRYKCDVCDKDFDATCWLYFCGDCRYFAHLKCVTSITAYTTKQSIDESDVIQFPLADIPSMLITPFVMGEKGIDYILNVNDMPTTTNAFNYHKHPLSLVLEDNNEGKSKALVLNHDDDEDEEMKICEVCVTPISSPPYYQCIACRYFIHLICRKLPRTLSSSSSSSSSTSQYNECPYSDDKNHKFALYASSEESDKDRSLHRCDLCGYYTNGMVYMCEECGMSIDVKCASLPTAIKHASHSHSHSHPNLIFSTIKRTKKSKWIKCYCCANFIGAWFQSFAYYCSKDGCEFALDLACAQIRIPPAVRKPEWDHHPLLLTFGPSDHPSDFFCEFCEKEMHPKKPMYHMRSVLPL